MAAPSLDGAAPGFVLLDDAEGRFTIDPESGIVSLADEEWLAREFNVVHHVRLRALDHVGAASEISLRLKITGMVPSNADDDFFGAAPYGVEAPAAADWERYFSCLAKPQAPREDLALDGAAFGALCPTLAPDLLAAEAHLAIALPRDALLAPTL